ncbi:hypothetical protein THAOC_15318 [Thalassiosira oceanica]|uniref:Uncharacterized protein n=1 Tax=Thalassiosira oceanica TaxID=159749 RepID=K0SF35_THAOC|nr:hypothetical protein THAOC_15318 [Thalassiosira oceanica]|eukprot:EJK63995.1 hypothetical protein THAOC_15318 [Thalassiosira oceanica]
MVGSDEGWSAVQADASCYKGHPGRGHHHASISEDHHSGNSGLCLLGGLEFAFEGAGVPLQVNWAGGDGLRAGCSVASPPQWNVLQVCIPGKICTAAADAETIAGDPV